MNSILIILIISVELSSNSLANPVILHNLLNASNVPTKFGNNESITYATSSVGVEDFNEIFNNHQPHVIYDFMQFKHEQSEMNHIYYDFYIIFDNNLINFNQTINKLLTINNLHVHGKYFVIIRELLNRNDIVATFEFLFKEFDIYNIILLNNGTHFTWYPYRDNCNRNIMVHEVQQRDVAENFENKLPTHLNNCEFPVLKLMDDILMGLISKSINATFTTINNSRFVQILSKNLEDINNVMKRENFIMVSNFWVLDQTAAYHSFQQSVFISFEMQMLILLPPRRLIPKWQEFKVFSNEMILAIIITITVSGVVYALLAKQTIMESFFRMYQLSLKLSMNMLPTQWRLRLYFVFLFFFVNIISSAYLSVLSGVFTRPSLEPKLRTLQEFLDSDIPLKIEPFFLEALKPRMVENRRKPWSERKFIVSWPISSLADLTNGYAIHTQRCGPLKDLHQHVEVLLDHVRYAYYYLFFRKRLHLNNLINYHLMKIVDLGFMGIEYDNMNLILFPNQHRHGIKSLLRENVTVLTMVDLSGVFIIWFFGLVFATIAFVFEIIEYKRQIKLQTIQSK